jgi:hypothetical protein
VGSEVWWGAARRAEPHEPLRGSKAALSAISESLRPGPTSILPSLSSLWLATTLL